MDQLHKRFTVEQVQVLLQGYCRGTMSRAEVEEMLHIGKTRGRCHCLRWMRTTATAPNSRMAKTAIIAAINPVLERAGVLG